MMNSTRRSVLSALAGVALAATSSAQTVSSALSLGGTPGQPASRKLIFTKIADTTMTPPGGSGTFSVFHDARAIDGGQVVFIASDSAGGSGVYSFQGNTLDVIADKSTTVPGVGVSFNIFFQVVVDGGVVSFTGGWPGPSSGCSFNGSEGLLQANFDGTGLTVVADSVNDAPNCFHGIDSNQGVTAVCAGVNSVDSIHNHSESIQLATPGGLSVLVDTMTPPPVGSAPFLGFDQDIVLDGGGYLFGEIIPNTFGAVGKIYSDRNDGFGLQLVADDTTMVPAGSGTFTNFGSVDFHGGEALFMGRSPGAVGIYAGVSPTSLRVIANSSTQVPGEAFNFLGFANPVAYNSGVMAFSGYWGGGGYGLFIARNGNLQTIAKKGDVIAGTTVEQAFCRNQDISGTRMLIEARSPNFATRTLYLVEF